MLVHVSSAIVNTEQVRRVMAMVRDNGHQVTRDWTEDVVPPPGEPDERREELLRRGRAEYAAIRRSALLILLNHRDGVAMHTEYGIALGAGRPVWVVNLPRALPSLFDGVGLVTQLHDEQSVPRRLAYLRPPESWRCRIEWHDWEYLEEEVGFMGSATHTRRCSRCTRLQTRYRIGAVESDFEVTADSTWL